MIPVAKNERRKRPNNREQSVYDKHRPRLNLAAMPGMALLESWPSWN